MTKYLCSIFLMVLMHYDLNASHARPESNEESVFLQFSMLPSDLQVYILSKTDSPCKVLMLNKALREKLQRTYLARHSNLSILKELKFSVNMDHQIIPEAKLIKELDSPMGFHLMGRLLSIAKERKNEVTSAIIRGVLTNHLRAKPTIYRDKVIELSRAKPEISKEAIKLIRGCFPQNIPVIHSMDLPAEYRPYIQQAIMYSLWSLNNRVIRTWIFPESELKMLKTCCIDEGEDKIVENDNRRNLFSGAAF